jgi:peptide/nickel transport system substrate-binding protein
MVICAVGVTLGGCASGATPGAPTASSDASSRSPQAAAPKTLQLALQGFQEPKSGIIEPSGVGSGGFDPLEHFLIFHSSLTVYDPLGRLIPRLAEKVPSLDDGDWKVLPDGRMELTWRLRPDLQWHDGTALSAEDFVFGSQIVKDPDVPATRPAWGPLVTDALAPDARTLVLVWKESSFLGGGTGAGDLTALPRHRLADLYQAGDKQAFINSTSWTTDFVGLGPYKLVQWQRGSFIEAQAFDQYVLGRPKTDRILIKYVGDVNAIVAGMLGGDLDIVPMGARFDSGQVVAVRDAWGPDGGMATVVPFGIRTVWLQFRDPNAPWARDVRVRRALAHATDRQGMSDALQYGLTPPADTFVMPEDPAFRLAESQGLARYPYDLNRTWQLLAEAGWTMGADNTLRDRAGQPLALDVSATGQGSNVQEIETVASQWQSAGFRASVVPLPPQAANLDERKNTVAGAFVWPWSPNLTAPQNLITAQISTERTAWKGRNYGGYSSTAYDALYDRFAGSLQPEARDRVTADLMKLIADDLPVIPIYYYGTGVVARKGISGPGTLTPMQTASTWNIETWEAR